MHQDFLFVCGCARSGTSVLRRLLYAHPEVAIGLERYIKRLRTDGTLSPELFERARFLNPQEGDTFYLSLDHFKAGYVGMAERYAQARYWGDKIPMLYRHYEEILTRFPGAKILFISRGLEDVALSYKRRASDEDEGNWGTGRGVDVAIQEWNEAHQMTASAMSRFPGQVIAINYESLFGEWKGVHELFASLDLKITPEVRRQVANLSKPEIRTKSRQTSAKLTVAERLAIWSRMDLGAWKAVDRDWLEPTGMFSGASTWAAAPASSTPKAPVPAPATAAVAAGGRFEGKYQAKDSAAFDYGYVALPGTAMRVRGPIPEQLVQGEYVSCLGGAQTLGRLVDHPYAAQLQARLGRPVLNLGFGGGKPEYFLGTKGVLELINRGRCAVVQVMSARGSPSPLMRHLGASDNMVMISTPTGERQVFVDQAYRKALKDRPWEEVLAAIVETRAAYVASMTTLLEAITVPKVLLWFSARKPAYQPAQGGLAELFGAYPQLVDEEMVKGLAAKADAFVECSSDVGLPFIVRARVTGEPLPLFPGTADPTVNTYYPSQQMHDGVAAALTPVLSPLVS